MIYIHRAFTSFLSIAGAMVVCLVMLGLGNNEAFAVNGACGVYHNGNYAAGTFPPNGNLTHLCDWGDPSSITTNPTTYTWTCGDDNVDCFANISTEENNGVCGSAVSPGRFYANGPPSTELCANDPANGWGGVPDNTPPPLISGEYRWDCLGTNGGVGTDYPYPNNPGNCAQGSDSDYPNCDECKEGTQYDDPGTTADDGSTCRIHYYCRTVYAVPVCGTSHGTVGEGKARYNIPPSDPYDPNTDRPLFVPSSGITDNLCNPGTHIDGGGNETIDVDTDADLFTWQCFGDGGPADTQNCSAPIKYDGDCSGVAHGAYYTDDNLPPVADRCGDKSDGDINFTFDGASNTYTWNCQGKNGGNDSSQCSATRIKCGPNEGGVFATVGDFFTPDNCAGGTSSAIDDTDPTRYTWTCNGPGNVPQVSCEASSMDDGECGLANGGEYLSRPSDSDLCDVGSPVKLDGGIWVDSFEEVGDTYTWTCGGPELNGGNPSGTCTADIQRQGECGSEGFDSSGPNDPLKAVRLLTDLSPDGLCDVGAATTPFVSIDGDTYEWGCGGVNNGPGVGCAVNIIKDAECDVASHGQDLTSAPISGARCSVGDESGVDTVVDNFPDKYEWLCDGPFGGDDASCEANIQIDGICGTAVGNNFRFAPTLNLCNAGILPGDVEPGSGVANSPVAMDVDEIYWEWDCMGQHNGDTVSCQANITKDGKCHPASQEQHVTDPPEDPNLCEIGFASVSPADYDPATFTYSWSCAGVNGGFATGTNGIDACEAYRTTDAACGDAINNVYYLADFNALGNDDLCDPGNAINRSPDDGPDVTIYEDDVFVWDCEGLFSGNDLVDVCQSVRKYDGVCGTADTWTDTPGNVYEHPPLASELCTIGNPSLVRRSTVGHLYEWTCSGVNGGVESALCDAQHDGIVGSIQTGIDQSASYIGVDYTPPVGGGAATFTCFEQNSHNFQAYFEGPSLLSQHLDQFEVDGVLYDIPPDLFSTDCLKQVGLYEFELFVVDLAGNASPYNGTYFVEVLPGDIDQNNSLWDDCSDELNYDDPNNDVNLVTYPSLIANGLDNCVFNLTLRDSEENLVTTIPSSQITMYSPTTGDSFIENPVSNATAADPLPWGDANLGVGFREGLRVDNPADPLGPKQVLPNLLDGPMTVPDRDGNSGNGLDFHLTGLAPSVIKLGTHAGAAAAGILEFEFVVPDIDDFGQVDYAADPVTISKSTPLFFYPMIRLQPNLMTYIDHLGYEQYAVFADSPIPVDNELIEYNNNDGGGDRLVEIEDVNAWLFTTVPESDPDPTVSTIDFDGFDVNIKHVDTDGDDSSDTWRYGYGWGPQNASLNQYDAPDGAQSMPTETGARLELEDLTTSTFENHIYTSSAGYQGQHVNLVTRIQYEISDPAGGTVSVEYPAGFIGSSESLGFDIDLLDTGLPAGTYSIIGNNSLFFFRFVGASIEGGVIGSLDRLSISGTEMQDFEDTYTAIFATGISANEAREAMRAQAFDIVNGRNPEVCGGGEVDFQSLMNSGAWDDQDVVYVDGCDVRIADDPVLDPLTLTTDEQTRYNPTSESLSSLMPLGQKTLVIQNGNLFIDNDLWYQDWIRDSFGFIIFNDELLPYPAEGGNIFIKHSVKRIVGTYYAEGGVFGTQGGVIDYNVFDPYEADEERDSNVKPTEDVIDDTPDIIANTAEGSDSVSSEPGPQFEAFLQDQVDKYNRNQLVLHGTLLSYNTLGGFHIWHSKIPLSGAPTNYFTAWNVMDDAKPDEENEAVAIQYDLHYLRRFNVHDWGTGQFCTDVVPNLGVCMEDANGDLITDFVQDLDGLDEVDNTTGLPPADGIPDGDGKADYTRGGFDSARCTPNLEDLLTGATPVRCDPNPNAFIIRNDQKVSKYPPPGFDVIGNMDLTQDN